MPTAHAKRFRTGTTVTGYRVAILDHVASKLEQEIACLWQVTRSSYTFRMNPPNPKRRVGRPKSDGIEPGVKLLQVAAILDAFNQARNAGSKYELALEAAVQEARRIVPELRTSITTVKNVLAEFQSEKAAVESLYVTQSSGREITGIGTVPDGTSYTLSFVDRPAHLRANRKNRSPR